MAGRNTNINTNHGVPDLRRTVPTLSSNSVPTKDEPTQKEKIFILPLFILTRKGRIDGSYHE